MLPSIDTLTIRRDPIEDHRIYLHRRDAKAVAVAGGMYHVVPAGAFQPAALAPACSATQSGFRGRRGDLVRRRVALAAERYQLRAAPLGAAVRSHHREVVDDTLLGEQPVEPEAGEQDTHGAVAPQRR